MRETAARPARRRAGGGEGEAGAGPSAGPEAGPAPGLDRALEAAGMVAWEWDLATDRVAHVGAAGALWGAADGGGHARDLLASIHPEDRDAVRHARDEAASAAARGAGGAYRCEYRVPDPGGGWRWLESRGRVERGAGGAAPRIVGVSLDVTDRKRAEEALRASEERHRGLFEGANDAIILIDLASGRYVDWNRRAEELTGYGAGELGALRLGDLAAPEHRERVSARLRALRDGDDGLVLDYELLSKDGRRLPAEISARIVRPGGVPLIQTILRDVGRRLSAERAAREGEARLRAAVECLPFDLWICDREGRYVLQNSASRRNWGDRVGLFPAQTDSPPEVVAVWLEHNRRALTGETVRGEASYAGPDGTIRHVDKVLVPVEADDGEVLGFVGLNVDVTERRDFEAALREGEERLRLAVEATGLGTWDVDPVAGTRRWSDEFCAILGLPPETSPDPEVFSSLIHPDDRDWVNERYAAAYDRAQAAPDGRYEAEFRVRRARDGAERWVVTKGRVLFDAAGRPTRGIGTLTDTTARHAAEAAVRESEARYRALVETSPDAVFAHRDGTLVLANRQAAALFGAPDPEALVGRSVFDLVDEGSVAAARARTVRLAAPGATAELAGLTYRRLDGTPFPVEAAAAAVELDGRLVVQVVFRDVSARRAAEERQRLLSRELSHRVKNTLAVVQGIASQTLAGGRALPEAREILARRLRALANAHGLLTASEWRGASLEALVGDELEAFAARARLAGEPVTLGPRAALTLALVLHELATNAAKHGALSAPGGRVDVSWSAVAGPGGATFHLAWRESGGPPVRPPTRRGFGRALVEGVVAHELAGRARLDFREAGLAYELEAPLAQVLWAPA